MSCCSNAGLIEVHGTCPEQCQCDGFLMQCTGLIPHHIPEHITELELVDTNPELFVDDAFCYQGWKNITKLTIMYIETCTNEFSIDDKVFHCLSRLESIKIQSGGLNNFSSNTFAGLENVSSLHFENCYSLCTPNLVTALANNKILPKLTHLIF